jgi:group II intron reverse transcriptase/maturase
VKANKGSAGVDNETILDIMKKGEQIVITEIQTALESKRYRPRKVKRVYIPKPNGESRPLGIPTVRDRIVQASTKMLMEPIFEAEFLDYSYGFRPGRCAHDALEEIRIAMNGGYAVVLDGDIKNFFDSIDHDKLLNFVYQRVSDKRV